MCIQSVRNKYLFNEVDSIEGGEYPAINDDITLFNTCLGALNWERRDIKLPDKNNHIELPTKKELENKIYVDALKDYFYIKHDIFIDNCPELQSLAWRIILRDSENQKLKRKIAQVKNASRYKPKLKNDIKKLREKRREIRESKANQIGFLIFCLSSVFVSPLKSNIKEWRKKPNGCRRHPRLSSNYGEPDWHDIAIYLRYLSFCHYSDPELRRCIGSSDSLSDITATFTEEHVKNRYKYYTRKHPKQMIPSEIKRLNVHLSRGFQ